MRVRTIAWAVRGSLHSGTALALLMLLGGQALGSSGDIPFVISVDGQTVDASGQTTTDTQHKTDTGLGAVDIQVKFDGLDVAPLLNVRANLATGQAGGLVFQTLSNYPGYISRAEIRIMRSGFWWGAEDVAVLPVAINGQVSWVAPAGDISGLTYALRVYDEAGRFDETAPLPVLAADRAEVDLSLDRAAMRNIAVHGGAVTVYGRSVPPGYSVQALGEVVPLDADRAFLMQRILPPGDQPVEVSLTDANGAEGLQFSRDINIPDNDWFYVALADLTVGMRSGDTGIEAVRPGEYDRLYSKGRLAFYLKGKIKGEYLLTAAADTDEEALRDLFGDIDGRNPRELLRHLDPDDYYPVYGDDSIMEEDAPTSGKFYVRLERGNSYVLWGNYKTTITGTQFLASDRALYGANAVYRSQEVTGFGARRSEVTAYAALPDTLPQREEFLATGGSAYFLGRQDITTGSETITVETRDGVTGRVLQRRTLHYGSDYSFDYLQGTVILKQPLSWLTGTSGPVRDGAIGGDKIYLVAQYEFVPGAGDVDGYSYGGRAQHWLNDNLRLGITGTSETTGPADQVGLGADVMLRHSDTTFLLAEIAHSQGPGFELSRSGDGGLTWGHEGTSGQIDRSAMAWRLEGQADLGDLGQDGLDGTIGAYSESKEAGFSTLAEQADTDEWLWGLNADLALGEDVRLLTSYDDYSDGEGQIKREGGASLAWQLDDYWKTSFGLTYTELMSPPAIGAGKSGYDGSRLDAGMRIEHRLNDDTLLYGFGQATLGLSGDISRNDRAGLGAQVRLTDSLAITGEVSYGTHGMGALAGVTFDPNPDEHYYLGYRLDPARAFDIERSFDLLGQDGGTLVAGLQRRLDAYASAYSETSYDMFGDKRSLAQTYGILFTPDSIWNVDVGLVAGHVRDDTLDPTTGVEREDFDRYAPALAIAYSDEKAGIKAHARGEIRIEDSSNDTRDQNTSLLAGGLSWKTHEDWRLIANLDAVFSQAQPGTTAFEDTSYMEASLGYAYRPVDNDRLNALFKYTWLYDMPGNGQLASGATGDLLAPAQRSHVLSVDVDYDLLPWLKVGAKYGFRFGEVKTRAAGGFQADWQHSTAHLAIVRADIEVLKDWDALLEGRILHMPEAQTTDLGALAAVYRHLGENFKVGAGYNFGQFSDDMRDLTLNDRGVFLNVIAGF